jgi:hypothetical protein
MSRARLTAAITAAAIAAIAAVALASPLTASSTPPTTSHAAPGGQSSQRSVVYELQPVSTRSRNWVYMLRERPITPTQPFNVHSVGLLTVTVTGTFAGEPVALRMTDNTRVMQPGPTHLMPRGAGSSFSFTFAANGRTRTCGHTIRPEWRTPSGGTAHVHTAQIVITYTPDAETSPPCT